MNNKISSLNANQANLERKLVVINEANYKNNTNNIEHKILNNELD